MICVFISVLWDQWSVENAHNCVLYRLFGLKNYIPIRSDGQKYANWIEFEGVPKKLICRNLWGCKADLSNLNSLRVMILFSVWNNFNLLHQRKSFREIIKFSIPFKIIIILTQVLQQSKLWRDLSAFQIEIASILVWFVSVTKGLSSLLYIYVTL